MRVHIASVLTDQLGDARDLDRRLGDVMAARARCRRVLEAARAQGADAWAAAIEHPMVKDIADGSLPHEIFRRYFMQNVLYLEEYARAIGIIVGEGSRP